MRSKNYFRNKSLSPPGTRQAKSFPMSLFAQKRIAVVDLQYRSEISEPKHTRNTRIPMRVYAYGHMRIRVCLYLYTKYTRMLISIYELHVAYCCFLCNTVVECCFYGPVILGLYWLTKSLRAKYGSTSHSFTKYFYRMRSVALQ